jgi:hypothetical protein
VTPELGKCFERGDVRDDVRSVLLGGLGALVSMYMYEKGTKKMDQNLMGRPVLPAPHFRKNGTIDWKMSAADRAIAFEEVCDALEACRKQLKRECDRWTELEMTNGRMEHLAEANAVALAEATRQIEVLKNEKMVATAHHLQGQSIAGASIEAMRHRMGVLLRTVADLAHVPPVFPAAEPASRQTGLVVHLPWGSPEDTDSREVAPNGPVRTYLIRSLVQLWMEFNQQPKTFAQIVQEVVAGAEKEYPRRSNPARTVSDTNVARYLAKRLNKTFPF